MIRKALESYIAFMRRPHPSLRQRACNWGLLLLAAIAVSMIINKELTNEHERHGGVKQSVLTMGQMPVGVTGSVPGGSVGNER